MGGSIGSVARRSIEVTLKDKVYTAMEPDIDELALFESHIKSQRLKMFLEASNGMKPADKQAIIQDILKTPIESDEIQVALTTLDGVRYMIYLVLKANPGVTLESMGDIVDLSNLNETIAIIDALGGEEVDPPVTAKESP